MSTCWGSCRSCHRESVRLGRACRRALQNSKLRSARCRSTPLPGTSRSWASRRTMPSRRSGRMRQHAWTTRVLRSPASSAPWTPRPGLRAFRRSRPRRVQRSFWTRSTGLRLSTAGRPTLSRRRPARAVGSLRRRSTLKVMRVRVRRSSSSSRAPSLQRPRTSRWRGIWGSTGFRSGWTLQPTYRSNSATTCRSFWTSGPPRRRRR
ncbi:hypothetical protein jaqu_35070 [Jannaschia aquimarina]|uniref:Uncharacterized protein n=1 Tax=Jannaschia aquimarina TaxID=935700 RepID=A0A0D1EAP0_9RHOB|nr:hypothetical protein jaqu_35070 [Jannaschia aquimarina]